MPVSLKLLFLAVSGLSYGMLASAGVFTVLAAVGLIPRFAGKTHTAGKAVLYEEMVIGGTIVGGLVSVFERYCHFGDKLLILGLPEAVLKVAGTIIILIFGMSAGMFIGCLALAIAEMLNSIPIFARRAGFRHGLGIVICAVAAGKLVGSLLYFILELHKLVP